MNQESDHTELHHQQQLEQQREEIEEETEGDDEVIIPAGVHRSTFRAGITTSTTTNSNNTATSVNETTLQTSTALLQETITTHIPRRRAIVSLRAAMQERLNFNTTTTATPTAAAATLAPIPVRPPWLPTIEEDARYRTQRRIQLLQDLQQKQRSSCKFCILISLAPIVLLLIRIFAPITEDIHASACRLKGDLLHQAMVVVVPAAATASGGNMFNINSTITCAPERAHFINAFTSRCLCTALDITTLNTNQTDQTKGANIPPTTYP